MIQPEAFILLNLPNSTLKAGNTTYDGTLALECVTISVSGTHIQDTQTPARDVFLVLRIKSFETPLDPARTVHCSIQNGFRYYSFLGGSGEDVVVRLHEPGAHEPHVQEDLDTFDSILTQYADFQGPQPQVASTGDNEKSEDLRGRLVLVNEDNGEVVGELDNQFMVQEDPALNDKGREKEPVIVEIPEGGEENARTAFVHAVPPGEEDMIIKGASLVSYAISGTTNLLLTAITSASSYVIKNSEPHPSASTSKSPSGTPPPLPPRAIVLLTSERTRKGLSTVHAMSGQAVQVSATTVRLLDSMIKRAVGKKGRGRGTESAPMSTSMLSPGSTAPPIARSRSPSPAPPAYTEKPPLPPRRGPSPQPPLQPPRPGSSRSISPNPTGKFRKRDRFMISADLILSTIDDSAKQILDVGGQRLNAVVEHKYGADAARSTSMLTGTAKNVGLVYIDMRGIGRRALIKRAGKEYLKAQVSSAASGSGGSHEKGRSSL